MPELPNPEYYIAVCGNGKHQPLPDLSSVYLDPNDELLDDIKSGGLSAVELPATATIALGQARPVLPSPRIEMEPGVHALDEPPHALRRIESARDAQSELRAILGRDSEQRLTIESLRDEVRDARNRNQTLERAVLEWRTVADEYAIRTIAQQTALDALREREPVSPALASALDAANRELAELRELVDLFVLDRQRVHELYLTASQRLHEADERLARTSEQLAETNDRRTAALERVTTLEAEIAAITSSRSWQLTKPIRSAAKSLKRDQ